MTAPAVTDPSANATGTSIDEMEAQLAVAKEPPPPEPVKHAADDTPWKEALRISEEARARAEAAIRPIPSAPPSAPPPDADENLTDDQLNNIIETKGMAAAVRAVQMQTLKIGNRHIETRLSGLASAGAQSAENAACAKYALEFSLFKDEIDAVVKNVPDRAALNSPENWDNLVAYVRGKEGNIQKYIAKLGESTSAAAETAAREAQRAIAGVHTPSGGPTSGAVVPGADGFYGLDGIEREIADKLGRDYKDYATWKRVG